MRSPRGLPLALVAVPLLLALASCGKDDVDAGPPVSEITITSTKTAFDVTAFAVRAGREVTVTYVNNHAGVQHNVDFKLGGGADAKTDLEVAPNTQTITFRAPDKAGTFTFICDAHPQQMRGKLVVVADDASG